MTSPKTPSTLKDDLNYDESYNLNETELNILRSLNPKGHIYNDYISNNIRIKAIRAGFLAGQKAEQQRILGIIEKKKKEVKQKNKDKSLPDLVKANLAGMYIALEELNQDIKSLINSPKEISVVETEPNSSESPKEVNSVSADRMPLPISTEVSPTPTIYGGGCPEYYNNQICTCGHRESTHTMDGRYCGHYACNCKSFTPQPEKERRGE